MRQMRSPCGRKRVWDVNVAALGPSPSRKGHMRTTASAACLLLALVATSAFADPAPPAAVPPAPPPRSDVLFLPLHVHILSAPNRPDIDCKLTDADLARILAKVNKVWRQAGVQFVITLHHEPAADLEAFDLAKSHAPPSALSVYRTLAPQATRDLPGLHVYYVHELPPNGVYLGRNICFVKETAKLRAVEGGIDEPIPRVTSHELGHGLGLPHRQATTNLMASGTTGTLFNDEELMVARAKAKEMKGALTLPEAEQAADAAEKAGEQERAKALRDALGGA
jgi:hypothetical protein